MTTSGTFNFLSGDDGPARGHAGDLGLGPGRHHAPGVDPMPTWPNTSPQSSGQTVVSVAEQWNARAAAADRAREELLACQRGLKGIVKANYFGEGCAEGAQLFDALSRALGESGLRHALTVQIDELQKLADTCRAAAETYTNVDTENSRDFPR